MQVPREISYEDLQKLMLKEMCQVIAERVLESAQAADIFRARIAEAHRPRDPAYLQPEVGIEPFMISVLATFRNSSRDGATSPESRYHSFLNVMSL